jgi:uncharacterized protein YbbK (DUF523 family)
MEKVLVSACLIGEPVRYDGSAAGCEHPVLARWRQEARLVPCCPEMAGGLGTPRPPMELVDGDGDAALEGMARVLGQAGEDGTRAFIEGARATLELCRRLRIRLAVLKERSPSCGSGQLHDGTFTNSVVPGQGVTAALLRRHGIAVYSETQWDQAHCELDRLERRSLSCPPVPIHRTEHPEG